MRVAWLTPELPYWPGGSGGSTRQHMLIRALRERGHEVDVVSTVHPDQRGGVASLETTGAALFAAPRPASRAREVIAAAGRRPGVVAGPLRLPLLAWQVDVFWSAMRDQLTAALARSPDLVHVEHDWAAHWAADLPVGVPRTLGLENLTWEYYEARAAAAGGGAGALMRAEAGRWKRHDRRWLPRYDHLLTMSGEDSAAVAGITTVPATVVANGVDTTLLTPSPLPGTPTALFTGTLDYPPNAEALRWLLEQVWPLVRRDRPDADLLVVGRGGPEDLIAKPGDGVTIAGFVPEMQPWFDRAQVVLVPILSGGGTRLKVLDGLASGRPLVSTTAGAAGVTVVDGETIVIADEAERFAAETVALLCDPARAQAIGAAGRQLAERRYDWQAIGDVLERTLSDVAARAPRTR